MKLIVLILLFLNLPFENYVLINEKFVQDMAMKEKQFQPEGIRQDHEGIRSVSINFIIYCLKSSLLFTTNANDLISELNKNKELILERESLKIINTYFIVPLIHSP
jgi:hypothetical protein